MDTSFIIDAVVIALLAATIFYAFRLERKLDAMRKAQTALVDVIKELNTATARAESGIQGLKAAAVSSGQTLEEHIKRARGLSHELSLLVQAGQRFGQKLETPRSVPRAEMQHNEFPRTAAQRQFASR